MGGPPAIAERHILTKFPTIAGWI